MIKPAHEQLERKYRLAVEDNQGLRARFDELQLDAKAMRNVIID